MANKIVFEIGVKNAGDLASKSQQAGQQAGQSFQKGFNQYAQGVPDSTKRWLRGLSPTGLNRVLSQDKELRDALAAEYMGSKSGLGKATYASASGQEFPIEKYASKFGAAKRQLSQAMGELKPALKDFKRLMDESMRWDPNLLGQYHAPRGTGGMLTDSALRAGTKRALAMGPLRTGTSIILPSDRTLTEGAKSLMGMGELQTGRYDMKRLMYGLATAPFSPWVAARELAGSGFFGSAGGGGKGGKGFGIWGAAGFEGFMKAFLALQVVTRGLQFAFQNLTHAVEQGSRLYQQSASVGMRPRNVAQLQAMFTGIGLSPDLALRMMTQARMGGTRAGIFTNVNGMAMRAQLNGASIEEVMQIKNMGAELKWLSEQTKYASSVLGDTAGSMQRIYMQSSVVKMEWTAMWTQMADTLEPVIIGGMKAAIVLMDVAIALEKIGKRIPILGGLSLEDLQKLSSMVSGTGKGPGNQLISGAPVHNMVGGNPFARIGFTFGNFGMLDYARQTAKNTQVIANAVTRGGGGRGGWDLPLLGGLHNMP